MNPEAIAAAFGTEVVDGEDLVGDACTWSGCTVTDVLVLRGEDPWCLEHYSDDALPNLMSGGGLAACEQCGRSTSTRIPDGPPLHLGCRRDHQARRVRATAVEKAKGAYARRRQRAS